MNTTGTNGSNCAETVPTGLMVLRKRVGAETPAGRRCSNIDEMLQAGAKPADIAIQVRELAALVSKGEL